jgi:hypothetical protein
MKPLFLTLLLVTLCATGYGQTIKALGYDTASGEVVYTGTNVLTFTTAASFDRVFLESGLQIVTQATTNIFFSAADDLVESYVPIIIYSAEGINFLGANATTAAAETRTNLGIPLPALTNTNNATMMRALAGSTNTNEPFSGTITVRDDGNDNRDIVISNGIILSVSISY